MDHSTFLSGIFHRLRTGCPWRDLPGRYSPWQTVSGKILGWQEPAAVIE